MPSNAPAQDAPPTDPGQVLVTVTTVRAEQPVATRHSTAAGDFETAVREALTARLAPWAIDQVLGRVLARRPAAGDAAEYEGSFSPTRQIVVSVRPVADPDAPCKTRRLAGLFLPAADRGATPAVPA
jgi:hypothetical protein